MPSPTRVALMLRPTSFVGRHVSRALRDAGWEVHGVDVEEAPRRRTSPRLVSSTGATLPLDADLVVSAIVRASDVGWRRRFVHENVDPVRAAVRAVEQLPSARLVHVSTTDVYGLRDFHGECEERLPLAVRTRNPYPRSAIAAEHEIARGLQRERYTILRPGAIWGSPDAELVRRTLDFLRRSSRVPFFGTWRGRNVWPFVHVRNLAQAVRAVADDPDACGRCINVIDPERTTVRTFMMSIARVAFPDRPWREAVLPYRLLAAHASLNTAVANLLDLERPLLDPSLYALHSLDSNLEFDNRRLLAVFERQSIRPLSWDDGLQVLARELVRPAGTSPGRTLPARDHRVGPPGAEPKGHSHAARIAHP